MNAWKIGATLAVIGGLTICLYSSFSNAQQTKKPPEHESPPDTSPDETTQSDPSPSKTEKEEGTSADSKSFWMTQKLRLSKELLAALASADFEAILKNADRMRGLNRVEKFVRRKPEGYRDQLRLFNMANQSLIKSAEEKNLEGATLAFNQMTISCMRCHQQLRDIASAEAAAK